MITRRDFIGASAMGIAMSATGQAAGSTGSSADTGRWMPPTDDEVRDLMSLARFGPKEPVSSTSGLVISSHPLVSRIASDILELGGNPVDAYLAAALAQTVIEPHMTTITGYFGLTYFDAQTGEVESIDGTANVPFDALPYQDAHFYDGRAAVVPGWWAGFELAYSRFATLPRATIMQPAIHFARHGYPVYPFLWGEMFTLVHYIGKSEQGREIYMPDGYLLPQDGWIRMPRAAETLERLQAEGNDYYYHGEFAQKFCDAVQNEKGVITRRDFEAYEAFLTRPIVGTYRGYEVHASHLPGGAPMIFMLNMLEQIDLQKFGPPTEDPYVFAKMLQILVAGRDERVHWTQLDPEAYPFDQVLSKDYAAMRLALLEGEARNQELLSSHDDSNHISIVDKSGNVLTALHTSGADGWLNGIFVDGISVAAAGFFGTAPRAGRRQRSFVSETLVMKNGKPVLACGSPGSGLAENILQNTVNLFDYGYSIRKAVHEPRIGGRSYVLPGFTMIECDMNPSARKHAEKQGYRFEVVSPWDWHHGSLEGILIQDDGVRTACGDPRRNSMPMAVET